MHFFMIEDTLGQVETGKYDVSCIAMEQCDIAQVIFLWTLKLHIQFLLTSYMGLI